MLFNICKASVNSLGNSVTCPFDLRLFVPNAGQQMLLNFLLFVIQAGDSSLVVVSLGFFDFFFQLLKALTVLPAGFLIDNRFAFSLFQGQPIGKNGI